MSESAPRAGAEAARLLRAAQEWLRSSAPHLAPVDVDGSPCSCPLCRGVATVRDADPDTFGVWVDGAVAAFESMAEHAAAAVSREAPAADQDEAPDPSSSDDDAEAAEGSEPAERRGRGVRRIPLDRPEGPGAGP